MPMRVWHDAFAGGSHEVGYLGDIPISDESEAKLGEFL